MTPEQLLTPRYKVIAPYPASPYNVGDILIFWEIIQGYDKSERPITIDLLDGLGCEVYRMTDEEEFKKYPHIFNPLQWWEERTIEDMPQYAKVMSHLTDGSNPGDIVKIDTVEIDAHWKFLLNDAPVMYFIPVTESEYTTYINSKK